MRVRPTGLVIEQYRSIGGVIGDNIDAIADDFEDLNKPNEHVFNAFPGNEQKMMNAFFTQFCNGIIAAMIPTSKFNTLHTIPKGKHATAPQT